MIYKKAMLAWLIGWLDCGLRCGQSNMGWRAINIQKSLTKLGRLGVGSMLFQSASSAGERFHPRRTISTGRHSCRWSVRDDGLGCGLVFECKQVVERCDLVALRNRCEYPAWTDGRELNTFCSRVPMTSLRCSARALRLGTFDTASMILYWSASSV